jgi:hypothetical protein
MHDPKQIWEFGRWIARRDVGSVRLSWPEGEVRLGVREGRVHSVEGIDSGELANRLGCTSLGDADLLAEARALGRDFGIPETKAMGAAKEMLQEVLLQWLTDPDREFDADGDEPPEADGATISLTHAVVELILADTQGTVAESVLPDRDVFLKRSGSFLDLYVPLRLSEEADLIVANITGELTAADLAGTSDHSPDEVLRLEAALVAGGMLEAQQRTIPVVTPDWPDTEFSDDEVTRKKIPGWMLGVAAAVLVVIIAVVVFAFLGGDDGAEPLTAGSGDWGVVVEMGCEPQDLQRMVRKRNLQRKSLRTIKADPTNGDTCFRLVWGSFPSKEDAESALGDIPADLIEEGFQPHAVEITDAAVGGEIESEG